MKIFYASDTHVHPTHLDSLLRAAVRLTPEAVIIGGDLIPSWKGSIAASIEPHKSWVRDNLLPRLRRFRDEAPGISVLLDLGNDDIAASRPLLEDRAGQEYELLDMNIVKLGDQLAAVGYMKVNPTPFLIKDAEKPDCRDMDGLSETGAIREGFVTRSGRAAPFTLQSGGETIEDDLEELSRTMKKDEWRGRSFLFASHAPPRNTTLDTISSGLHVGSLAVRRFIEKWSGEGRLIAALHGHIHESPWASGRTWQYIGKVPCFNVGQKSQVLRALLLDTEDAAGSARLVTVQRRGEINVHEKDDWI